MPVVSRRDVLLSGLAISGSALVPGHALAQTRALVKSVVDDQALPAVAPRERLLFDFDWKFTFGNADKASKDLGFGGYHGPFPSFSKTGLFKFATGDFNDSDWQKINLPHDWAVELPFVWDNELKSRGYKPLGRKYPATSIGWYRREFEVPSTDLGRRILVQFDGAFRDVQVFINGCYLGRHDHGYTPFLFDLTDFLHYGKKNYLVVRVNAAFGSGWFYEGAGVYRHVWLIKQDKLHLGQWESYVRTRMEGNRAVLHLGTIAENDSGTNERVAVKWEIRDSSGKTVATAEAPSQTIPVEGSATYTATARIDNPALWSPETPNLYSAVVTLTSDGKLRDAENVAFGVRTIHFDVNKGFFLNGKRTTVQGTCNHQDHAGVGVALPDRLQYYRAAVLKAMGCNAVRTSHNMPTPEWVEACDRMGLLMLCETRTMSTDPGAMEALSAMIKRYRNSPAIILWSMGNEEHMLQKSILGTRIVRGMKRRSHKLDPTRLCTAAVSGNFYTGVANALDVEGINYNLPIIDQYHKSHPERPMIGTETASAISERGIYRTDPLRNRMSAYDTNQPGWGETAEQWWQFYAARKFLAGGFAWTGFDYRGEPTPYGWPSISSYFGIVDTCGYPKDTFYYYKSAWSSEPMLHLFPHWNFSGEEGNSIPVWVYSNLDEVELIANGKSMGKQKMPHLSHLHWDVKYEPGYIEALGFKNGKVVMMARRETTGAPASIHLTADRTTIHADGEDVAVICVEARDAQGRLVPTAEDLIHFDVTGDGALIGVGNGNPTCQESDKAPKRSLFNGLAQVILQASKSPGQIVIKAYSKERPHLASATLTIPTQKAEIRPEVT